MEWIGFVRDYNSSKRREEMAKRSAYQERAIKNYYKNRDAIMLQRLGELVTDLYLAEGKSRSRIWQRVSTALEMLDECQRALPADIAVCAAAVADWRPAEADRNKIKKTDGEPPPLGLVENPDILATLAAPGQSRPALVIGFAAETESVVANAAAKLEQKKCDWVVANDVSPSTGTFGGDQNKVHLVTGHEVEDWPIMDKSEVANRLVARIANRLAGQGQGDSE